MRRAWQDEEDDDDYEDEDGNPAGNDVGIYSDVSGCCSHTFTKWVQFTLEQAPACATCFGLRGTLSFERSAVLSWSSTRHERCLVRNVCFRFFFPRFDLPVVLPVTCHGQVAAAYGDVSKASGKPCFWPLNITLLREEIRAADYNVGVSYDEVTLPCIADALCPHAHRGTITASGRYHTTRRMMTRTIRYVKPSARKRSRIVRVRLSSFVLTQMRFSRTPVFVLAVKLRWLCASASGYLHLKCLFFAVSDPLTCGSGMIGFVIQWSGSGGNAIRNDPSTWLKGAQKMGLGMLQFYGSCG